MRFSERYGYKPVREVIQKESMDDSLKNALWNALNVSIFNNYCIFNRRNSPINGSNLETFFISLFHGFFKSRIDQIPYSLEETIKYIDYLFFEKYKWYEIYDLIEACLDYFPFETNDKEAFADLLNSYLEAEKSAYKIINYKVIEITSEQEIQSIEEALKHTNEFSGVQEHLQQALKLMADRQNPDYRNSIKESVSALEGICQKILKKDKVTLGDAIGQIEKQYPIHPALKASIKSLYGYTSDADGIRHAMLDESNLSYIDAKFMLVACTNFINYLIDKTRDHPN